MRTKNSDGSITLIGGLVRKESKMITTSNGEKKICNFALATSIDRDKKIFDNCTAWGKFADCIESYEKGDTVGIVGIPRKDDYYSEKEGKTVFNYTAQAIFNCCQFKNDSSASDNAPAEFTSTNQISDFEIVDTDDIPF